MKLASVRYGDQDRVAVALGDGSLIDVLDLLSAVGEARLDLGKPIDVASLIDAGEPMLNRLREALIYGEAHRDRLRVFTPNQLQWYPPLRRPSKIICIALNNRSVDAMKLKGPTDHPAFFLKPSTALTGHNTPIRLRPSYGLTHSEPELAVVIGRTLADISPDAAYDGVFGYSIMNDVTSVSMRDEDSFTFRYFKQDPQSGEVSQSEAHTSYAGRYKGSDTFAPCGPFVVTRDEIPDPHTLEIRCTLGEQLVASDQTKNYVWSVPAAISHISRYVTLLPGDIVAMGTAATSDRGRAAGEIPVTFRANLQGFRGLVSVSISGIGCLSNSVETLET